MDTLKVLADTNMKIGEAKLLLQSLSASETEYLQLREEKALDRINKMVSESSELLDTVTRNYSEVTDLANSASVMAAFLVEAYDVFHSLIEDFNKHNDEWEEKVRKNHEELSMSSIRIRSEQNAIDQDKKSIASAFNKIADEKRVIESRQQQIKSALAVLKSKQ